MRITGVPTVCLTSVEMADVLQQGWQKYLYALQHYPLPTKAITAGVLAGSSDVLAQKLAGAKSLEFRRPFFLALYGLLYGGPFGHFFHKLMDRIYAGRRDGKTVLKKVLTEQLTSGPWNNFVILCYLGLVLERRPWSAVKSRIRSDYPFLQLNSWKFWPIVSLLNYRFAPPQLRVLVHNLAAVCWGTFLIFMSKTRQAPALKKAV
ncbi:hypothetical protein R1flu_023857 [Riccia fluitans]|uniref:Peroxisomal membrane protein PMP22 n=1 Tax=Riccia fluitans TaxID=41844 RepID=A0ABD1XT92_9MARC